MSFAQIIPDIITAYILPPGKVEALAKYKPVIGVLKCGFLTSIDWSKEYEAPSGIDVYLSWGAPYDTSPLTPSTNHSQKIIISVSNLSKEKL